MSHEIWHRCLPWGVDVQDTFFDSGRKCVAMVTAYYTVKKYCGAGILITFSDISSFHPISINVLELNTKVLIFFSYFVVLISLFSLIIFENVTEQ